MRKGESKLVSVIIPALHRPDLTRRCLESLARQTLSDECFEIVVVENEARPETNLSSPLPENVRVLELSENHGTTGSINRGCSAIESQYLLLLNNDVELEPDFLAELISKLDESEQYAFATGKLLSAADRNRLDGAGDALLAGGGVYRIGHGDLDTGQYDSCLPVIAGCGAATLVRRSVFDQIGRLDENFFAYLDDVDLGLRVHLYGHQGLYVPTAVAYHIGSATLGGDLFHPKIVEWLTRNQILLVSKDYPISALFRMLPRILVFQLLWLAVITTRGRLGPYFKGMFDAIRLLPANLRKRRVVMENRKISGRDFISLLRVSEQRVYRWHQAQPEKKKSILLKSYFFIFGRHRRLDPAER